VIFISVARNDKLGSNEWRNIPDEPWMQFAYSPQAYYDRRADVLSITLRKGRAKYVVVGRGVFVVYADDEGIWSIDLEAESWDSNVDSLFPKIMVEVY